MFRQVFKTAALPNHSKQIDHNELPINSTLSAASLLGQLCPLPRDRLRWTFTTVTSDSNDLNLIETHGGTPKTIKVISTVVQPTSAPLGIWNTSIFGIFSRQIRLQTQNIQDLKTSQRYTVT